MRYTSCIVQLSTVENCNIPEDLLELRRTNPDLLVRDRGNINNITTCWQVITVHFYSGLTLHVCGDVGQGGWVEGDCIVRKCRGQI